MKGIKVILLIVTFVMMVACSSTTNPGPDPNPIPNPNPDPAPSNIEVRVDSAVKPTVAAIEGLNEDDAPRAVTAFIIDGEQSDIVANELLLAVNTEEELNAFLARWNAVVLDSLERIDPADPLEYLVQVDPSKADSETLNTVAANLSEIEPDLASAISVADDDLLKLLAIAAYETVTFGTEVIPNVLVEQQSIQEGISDEASGDAEDNAFKWSYIRYNSPQSTGVDVAWKLLHEADKLDNSVNIMIFDGGFYPNEDFPQVKKIRKGQWESPAIWDDSKWHGTHVVVAAMGTLDNQQGAAGPAGPIHSRLTAVSVRSSTWKNYRRIRDVVNEERPDILNMSFSTVFTAFKGSAQRRTDRHFKKIKNAGVLAFASAGNDGKNVDGSDLIMPCQSKYVVCVGGMGVNTTLRDVDSNFGTQKSNRSVEIYGPYTVFSTQLDELGGAGVFASKRSVSGTSFSSPFVAGVAALVLAANPNLSHDEIKTILFDTAHVGGVGVSGYERRINAFGAVSKALNLADYKAPTISIDSLQTGDTFAINDFIDFSGEARDFRGNKLPILWESDIDEKLGLPSTIGLGGTLSVGTHEITATATDITGTSVEAKVTIEVGNTASVMKILTPTTSTIIYEDTAFSLNGISEDPDTNNNMLPNNKVRWLIRRASNNALVYDQAGHNRSLTLSNPGTYKVTFRGDDDGKISEDKVTITVLAVSEDNLPPVATILEPDNGDKYTYASGDVDITLNLKGKGFDPENGNLSGTRLRWIAIDEQQKETILCEGSGFTTGGGIAVLNNCAERSIKFVPKANGDGIGNYVIRLEVRDLTGQIGPADEVTISVEFVAF